MTQSIKPNPVRQTLERCRPHFVAAAIFSACSNILYLVPSIYMMQVYDRVVPTGGLATLTAISLIAAGGLLCLALLELLRSRVLVRAGARFDEVLSGQTLATVLSRPSLSRLDRSQAMREFDTLRLALSGPALIAAFDVPWFPIYILAATLLHPALGAMTLAAAVVLLLLAASNERAVREMTRRAADASSAAQAKQFHSAAHAQEARALGMVGALTRLHLSERAEVNRLQADASFAGGTHISAVKFLRLLLQSAAMGLGAVLVVEGKLSAGSMIAASLLLSRALAPIEQIVAAWKPILGARRAYRALTRLLDEPDERQYTRMPVPIGAVEVRQLTATTPLGERIALADLSFTVAAGEIVGVVGASGAGKSTLLRALAGADPVLRGQIRFDGAAATDWDRELLARHVGYLPQNFILFAGTVKENISRFRGLLEDDAGDIDDNAIDAACRASAHDVILRLPQGYDTPVGAGGIGLSAGQMQRIAIARALYGGPRILLLDEPTAHLDAEAQHAFVKTLSQLRIEGVTVLFATHSADILASADKLLALREGRIEQFGPLATPSQTPLRPISHTPAQVSR